MVLYSRESSFAFVGRFVASHAYIRVRVSQESHESEVGFAAWSPPPAAALWPQDLGGTPEASLLGPSGLRLPQVALLWGLAPGAWARRKRPSVGFGAPPVAFAADAVDLAAPAASAAAAWAGGAASSRI